MKTHNLTSKGVEQAVSAADSLIELIGADELRNVVILSSPFTRAYHTARICLDQVRQITHNSDIATSIEVKYDLRERYFGDYEATDLLYYNRVWPIDAVSFSCRSCHPKLVRISSDSTYMGRNMVTVLVTMAT